MQPKQLHDFLFQLYNYADYLADQIETQPDNFYNDKYFMSLLYIEDMMDTYGRGLIRSSAEQAGLDDKASLAEAHKHIDMLRQRIQKLWQEHNYNDVIESRTEKLIRDWRRPPTATT